MDKIHNHEVAGSIPAPATTFKFHYDKRPVSHRETGRLLLSNPHSKTIAFPGICGTRLTA